METSDDETETAPLKNKAATIFLRVWIFLALSLILAMLVAIGVQWRQCKELEVLAQLQKESNTAQITQLERELWHFDSAMTRTDSAPPDLTTEQGLRFNALAKRVNLLFSNNKKLVLLNERKEFKLLAPRMQDWVFRAKPLVDRQDWATSDWLGLMKELRLLAPELQALNTVSETVMAEREQKHVAAVQLQSQWMLWLTLAQILGLLLITVGLHVHRRKLQQVQKAQKCLCAQLMQAKEQAENAKQGENRILANMRHGLRTRFSGMLGMLGLLEKPKTTAEQADLIQTAKGNAGNLLALLNDVTEVSTMEEGKIQLRSVPTDMAEFLQEVHRFFRLQAQNKGLKLQLTGDLHKPCDVMLDPLRLRQILFVLLGNAIKYTDQGQVDTRVRRESLFDGVHWEIDIVDTGIGMSEATQQALFERFREGDAYHTRKPSESGLDLEISRSLAHLMGGELMARSQLGQGSVFTLSFKTPWATLTDCVSPSRGSGGGATPDTLESGSANEALRVLVAEDHPVNRKVVGLLLQSMGHQVSFAEDGQQALAQASQFDFDLVLMDIHMPVMDGLSSARQIRALPGERGRVPIVALTADVMNDVADQANAAGMNAFLSKPLQKSLLQAVMPRKRRQA